MIRHLILIIVFLSLVAVGCRSTSEKRANKDILGVNEQLFELEKRQIKDSGRLTKLETQITGMSSAKLTEAKAEEKEEDPENIYKDGYKKYLELNYPDAIKILSRLTGRFKDDTLIDNALYWQAESYKNMKQTDQALRGYQLIYRYFPFSNKADYALYKIGLIYLEMNDLNKAILAFDRLINEYPGSDLFKAVSEKIKEIKDKNKNRSKQ